MGLTVISRSETTDLNTNNSGIQAAKRAGSLLGRVFDLLEPWKGAFKQLKSWESAVHTLFGAMLSSERATQTASAVYRGAADQDQSKRTRIFSRSPWDLRDLAWWSIAEGAKEFGPNEPISVALDETHMRKVGHRIFGSGYGYDPQLPKFLKKKFNWMLRALHATFLIEDTAYRRPLAMPIWFEVLIAKLKRGKDLTKAEMKFLDSVEQADALVAKSIEMVHFIRKTLDESGHAHQTLRLFADNSFSNGNFMKSLPHNTVYVGRFKRNGGLYLPLKEKRGKTIYGDPLPKPHMLFADPQFRISQAKFYYGGGWSEFSFKDINNIYWKGGTNQQLVRLLLLWPIPRRRTAGAKLSYSQPAYLITTDLITSSQELIQGYLNRWQIEVMHRELKQDVGVGEMQGWTENTVRRFHGALALMYGLVSLAGHRMLKSQKVNLPPLPIWRSHSVPRRPSARTLITMLREDVERFGIYDRSAIRKKLVRRWKLPVQHSFVVA